MNDIVELSIPGRSDKAAEYVDRGHKRCAEPATRNVNAMLAVDLRWPIPGWLLFRGRYRSRGQFLWTKSSEQHW